MAVVIDFFVINFFVSRYGMADLFFNLHWDIDSESTAEPLPSGTGSELGPGAVIAAVNLGCAASVLFEPRYGDKRIIMTHPSASFRAASPAFLCSGPPPHAPRGVCHMVTMGTRC